jgi:hypothetical protein
VERQRPVFVESHCRGDLDGDVPEMGWKYVPLREKYMRAESKLGQDMNRVFSGVEKRQIWNWLSNTRIGDGNEPPEKCGVFDLVPISKDGCELVVLDHFLLRVKY